MPLPLVTCQGSWRAAGWLGVGSWLWGQNMGWKVHWWKTFETDLHPDLVSTRNSSLETLDTSCLFQLSSKFHYLFSSASFFPLFFLPHEFILRPSIFSTPSLNFHNDLEKCYVLHSALLYFLLVSPTLNQTQFSWRKYLLQEIVMIC